MRLSLLHVSASVLALSLLLTGVAAADDWVAVKLRGSVLQQVNGQWEKLEKGGVVPDDRMIRTTSGGRVTLTRGNETLDLGPSTQIQIIDKAGRKPFTTVKEYTGTVSVEAEVRQVQHFAVQTPYLAAVVKGTRFTVKSTRSGSEVEVERGHVAVEDSSSHHSTTIAAGQAAAAGKGKELEVSGSGKLPVVVDQKGTPVAEVAAPVGQVPAKLAAVAPGKPVAPEKLKSEPGKGPNGPKDSGGKGPKGDDGKGGPKDDKGGKGSDGPKGDSGKGPGGPKGDTSNGPGGPKGDSGKGPGGGSKGDSGSGPKGDSGKGPSGGPGGGGHGGGDHGGGDHGSGGGGSGKGKK